MHQEGYFRCCVQVKDLIEKAEFWLALYYFLVDTTKSHKDKATSLCISKTAQDLLVKFKASDEIFHRQQRVQI